MKFTLNLIVFLFFTQLLFAQGESAVPLLTFQQSPLLIGAGSIGSSIPTRDVTGHYYNPANLGYTAKGINFSTMIMPQNTNLYGYGHIQSRTFGITLGHNFKKKKGDLPLAIGFGYLRGKLSYGTFYVTDEPGNILNEFESYDSFDLFSLGANFEYYLDFNIGIGIKNVYSKVNAYYDTNNNYIIADANKVLFDFGTLITVPVSKLFFNNYSFSIDNTSILPYTNLTLGYSLSNFGGEIWYVDEAQKDPLPRMARTGYNFNIGFKVIIKEKPIKLFDYSFTAEADDILIKPRSFASEIEYQSFLGDIDYWDNVICLNSNDKVVVHKGHIFNLFETLIITTGTYNGRNRLQMFSNGYGFSSEGIFKLLSLASNSNVFNFVCKHIIIEYFDTNDSFSKNSSNYYSGGNSNYQGLSLCLKNIEL